MLRFKTETRPGLVTLYDIRPGNGADLFLQPRSPHGGGHPGQTQLAWVANSAQLNLTNTVSKHNTNCAKLSNYIDWHTDCNDHFTTTTTKPTRQLLPGQRGRVSTRNNQRRHINTDCHYSKCHGPLHHPYLTSNYSNFSTSPFQVFFGLTLDLTPSTTQLFSSFPRAEN